MLTSGAYSKGYCFPKSTSLNIVKAMISSIKHKKDKIEYKYGSNCVEIEASDTRLSVYEAMLNQHFSVLETYGGSGKISALSTRDSIAHCKFDLEEVSTLDRKVRVIQAGRVSRANQSNTNNSKTRKSSLMVIANNFASIQMIDAQVYMKCKPRGRNYEVEFSLTSETGGISTTVLLAPGQKQEIGSVVEDLNNKNREAGVPKGIKLADTKGFENKKFFLSIK